MQRSDLEHCDELRTLAGWNQRIEDWQTYLNLAPQGCFVAELEGRIAGTVTTINYEAKIGWIGMLLVHPFCRRAGVGTALLEHAVEHLRTTNVRTLKLDATPQGEPLYTRMGFEREATITRWLRKPSLSVVNRSFNFRALTTADMPAVHRFDERAFGAGRSALLEAVRSQALQTFVQQVGDEIVGFAMLRPGANANYLGPIVADREPRDLVLAAVDNAPERDLLWDLPELPGRPEFARELGFTPQRVLTRMRLGDSAGAQPGSYWGLVDPACG